MQVTVFGAGGKVGRQVVAELLRRGYSVVAAIHRKSPFQDGTPHLSTVVCDVHKLEQVTAAIHGSQVVISTLGSWGTPSKDIVSSGMATIIPTMQAAGIRRIISLTGSGAIVEGDSPGWLDKTAHRAMTLGAGKVLQDGEEHIRLLQLSDLEWTVLRSPAMTPAHSTRYALQSKPPLPWATIPRRAVSQAIVDQVDDDTHFRQSPYLHR